MIVSVGSKNVTLYGKAEVTYGKMNLKAAIISQDFNTGNVRAQPKVDSAGVKSDKPVFTQESESYTADAMVYNFTTKRAGISGLVTRQGEGIIYGTRVQKDSADNTYVRDAYYTTCDADHPHFAIRASRMKIITGKQVVSGPAYLEISDIPTPLAVPFGFFPFQEKRKSGIIFPGYGFSPNQGYFLRNGGYYFGKSDYADLALTGDIFSYGSWRVQAASNYALRYKFRGNFNASFAYNQLNREGDPDFQAWNNFGIVWNHSMDPKAMQGSSFRAAVNLGSSRNLALNSFNPQDIVTSQLNSNISYSKSLSGGKMNMGLNARHSQNTQSRDLTLILPEFTFDVARLFPFKRKIASGQPKWYETIGLAYQGVAQNQIQTKDSLLFTPEAADKWKNQMTHALPISMNLRLLKHITLSPNIQYNEWWYLKTTELTWNNELQKIDTSILNGFARAYSYSFNAGISTRVFGTYGFRSGKIKAIRHVVTPVLGISYAPDFSSDRFGFFDSVRNSPSNSESFVRYSRFQNNLSSGPGMGRTGLISLNVNNNLEMKRRKMTDSGARDEKVKLLEALDFGTSYNALAEQFRWAPFYIRPRTVLFKFFNIQANANFDFYARDSLYRRINKMLIEEGKLWRFTDGFLTLSAQFNSKTLKGEGPARGEITGLDLAEMLRRNKDVTTQELALIYDRNSYVDFNVPWNFGFNFDLRASRPQDKTLVNPNLNFRGDVNLTSNWKIGFSSGYNFETKQVAFTTIDFYRQMHCWEFRLNWIPYGFRQSFFFTMNVRSSVLSDLKINRRREWFDR